MIKTKDTRSARLRRARRVRARIPIDPERPRLSVFRSSEHIYAQVIDDVSHRTLAAVSTLDPTFRQSTEHLSKTAQAAKVGELLAQRALALGISKVAFDRSGFIYHGRVQALAEASRSAGLSF